MSLSTLLNVIWAEIWDDCSAMGDVHQYREIVTKLYWEGQDPGTIVWKGADGKTHRLSDQMRHAGEPTRSARDEMEAMRARARDLAEANRLASQPNGRE